MIDKRMSEALESIARWCHHIASRMSLTDDEMLLITKELARRYHYLVRTRRGTL